MRGSVVACTLAGLLVVAGAHAHGAEATDDAGIVIDRAWTRPMPGGSDIGAGYLVLRNAGEVADRLVAVTSPRAARAKLHESAMENDVMRMRPLDGGLEIASGATVEMRPGGLHIMFIGVAEPFAAGEEIPVRLVFQSAGERDVSLEVNGSAAPAARGTHHSAGHQHEDGGDQHHGH